MSAPLQVQSLLQNPMGELAPPGNRGDLVRVSDGRATVHLSPDEFDAATETELRYLLLARAARPT